MKTLLGGTCLLALASLAFAATPSPQPTKAQANHAKKETLKSVKHTQTTHQKKTVNTSAQKSTPGARNSKIN